MRIKRAVNAHKKRAKILKSAKIKVTAEELKLLKDLE